MNKFLIGDKVKYTCLYKVKDDPYTGEVGIVSQFYPNPKATPPTKEAGLGKDGLPYLYDVQFLDSSVCKMAAWMPAKEKELTLLERPKKKPKLEQGLT